MTPCCLNIKYFVLAEKWGAPRDSRKKFITNKLYKNVLNININHLYDPELNFESQDAYTRSSNLVKITKSSNLVKKLSFLLAPPNPGARGHMPPPAPPSLRH